ncbi:MAG: hypothetical protein KJ804_11905 [Proteobacteria bacterium]|nr:hypothetical protein [Pseudomonadota bacterium]MBU1059007.1 hypothetical protein [Pseudomonadota bacterium]
MGTERPPTPAQAALWALRKPHYWRRLNNELFAFQGEAGFSREWGRLRLALCCLVKGDVRG